MADDAELHHVVPKFMGGWSGGRSVVLSRAQHQQYHGILDGILARNGMPAMIEGASTWRMFLMNNPDRLNDVRTALVESVERFKAESGIDMWADLLSEMTKQGFAIIP